MRRVVQHEHLDGALNDRATLEGNLRDLRRINRILGGADLSVRAIRGLFEPPSPAARTARVVAIDSRSEVIDAALAISPVLRLRRPQRGAGVVGAPAD